MTRPRARRPFQHVSTRGRRYMDFFCPRNGGIRVGYASPALLRTLPHRQRHRVRGRVILVLTANTYYAIKGVRAGSRLAAARHHLALGRGFHVGRNQWYLAPDGAARAVLKVRRGTIQEIGIADRKLTAPRRSAARFLRSFS